MSYFEAIFLGLVQGLTEFIPISSSGHLMLSRVLFGIENPGLIFDVTLHLGTLLAVLIYFRRDLIKIVKNFTSYNKPAWLLLAGTIPAFVVGYFVSGFLEKIEDTPEVIALSLIVTGLFLGTAEWVYKKKDKKKIKSERQITYKDAISIGLAQAAALFPGISRSGVTISMGLFRSIKRQDAAKFSFLLAIPAIIGAGAYSLFSQFQKNGLIELQIQYLIGFIISFVTGYLAIKFLLQYLKKHTLNIFAGYLLVTGLALLIYFVFVK